MRPSSLRRPQQQQQQSSHYQNLLPPQAQAQAQAQPQPQPQGSFSSNSRNADSQSVRSKPLSSSRRSATPTSRSHHSLSLSSSSDHHFDNDPGKVRVAVRLRPKNAEDLVLDADSADCVELQPELNRLKLRKNYWNSESYRFDEVFTDVASQKRVYEAVAKPVVESVLNGYNGTVMAYGQTGTGKTYTVGRLGKDDPSERGIMVRALEDIIANTTPASDSIEVSYLQLYMESIQDLLAPEKINIPVNEDARTGEVSLPGATVVKLQNLDHFVELLQIGEANRHAANTKQNTESSRSHAILMVYIRRPIYQELRDEIASQEKDRIIDFPSGNGIPRVRKSKLLVVDLAGSERLDKSGSEGQLLEEAKFINLSLTSLGKCINALAENCTHIPTRDSKLTRLLRDSFGGSARTSLIITIGPSARQHAETASTIMFGQRAMRIVNMVKLKEEFDYESLCRKLETQVDHLTAEMERLQKLRDIDKFEFEKKIKESQELFAEEKRNLVTRSELLEKENSHLSLETKDISTKLDNQKCQNEIMSDRVSRLEMSLKKSQEQHQLENSMYQKVLTETTRMYEKKISELIKESEDERAHRESTVEEINLMKKLLSDNQKFIEKQQELEHSAHQKAFVDTNHLYENKVAELNKQLEDERACTRCAQEQLDLTKKLLSDCQKSIQKLEVENSKYQKALADNTQMYEKKIKLIKQLEDENAHFEGAREQVVLAKKLLSDQQSSLQDMRQIDKLKVKLQDMYLQHESTQTELQSLKSDIKDLSEEKALLNQELRDLKQRLLVEEKQRKSIEHELLQRKKSTPENHSDFEDKKPYMKENISKGSLTPGSLVGLNKSNTLRETVSGQRATIAKICEEVGLQKILQLLASQDSDVQIHAVKVIANLAAEDTNQEKIVEEGGLDALLKLLKSSPNATILRVASGAIANLAMNEINQGLIMSKGGAQLLAKTASKTDDPQTLRMVAGALANLCGNESLHMMLKEDGGIKALVGMARFANNEVTTQVARGMANYAKCESRGIVEGRRKGRSVLIEEGALEWLIANTDTTSVSTRRHVELALCHLAQNEENARDFIAGGGIQELVRISVESNRDDIRSLAKRTLKMNPTFQAEVHSRQ